MWKGGANDEAADIGNMWDQIPILHPQARAGIAPLTEAYAGDMAPEACNEGVTTSTVDFA